MKNSCFIFIFSLLLPLYTIPLEETQTVVPLIKRLKKIKTTSIKKHIIARCDKYKRCIWSGPCTQKEMNELQQGAKKVIYAIMITIAGSYILKYMYKAVEKKGEKPTIMFPVQWLRMKKVWIGKKRIKLKKVVKGGKKVLKVAEGLADGETQIEIQTPLGEVTVKPSPVPSKKQEKQPSKQELPQPEEEWRWRDSIMNPWNWVPTSIFEGPQEL